MTSRRNLKLKSAHKSSRRSRVESLERRELLAAELIAASANSGEQFDLDDNNVLPIAPTELKFRFGGDLIDQATLAGIQFRRAEGDGSFENGSQVITPGFLGFEDDDGTNIIVARFTETLPDDQYVVELPGFDDTQQQIVGIRDVTGELLTVNNALDDARPIQQVRFEVEVGPRVVSVVPQPIEDVSGTKVQRRDQIHVYFNEDPLSNPLAGTISTSNSSLPVVNPDFYKLIYTEDTVENTDDTVTVPISVEYDPLLHRAVLTFPDDLSELAPAAANDNSGTYRLRVGRSDALPAAPAVLPSGGGGSDTFGGAISLGGPFGGGTQSVTVTEGLIRSTNPIIPDWPGATDAPGLRENRRDPQRGGLTDTQVGINIFPYNFARIYGLDPQDNTLENAITPAQQQRIREVLDLYSERLGVEFVETEDQGLQIVTGDVRAIVISADTGAGADTPLSLYRVNERDNTRGVLVMDAGENWFDGYGLSPDNRLSYFVEALRGVGNLLGIGDLFELPQGVAAGGNSPDEPNSILYSDQFLPDLPDEPEFLSQSDITLGQSLHRPESNDVDFYSFSAQETGEIQIETLAERLDGSSLLDTHLQLYRVINAATDQYELIAQNDDFFSEDSFIGLTVEQGDYVIGVSASGNDEYNGLISGSGLGGVTEGRYELRVTFKPTDSQTLTDSRGTALDGDADGVAGGEFNFWFRVARDAAQALPGQPKTIFVDKEGLNAIADGSIDLPFQTLTAALAASSEGDIVRVLPNAGADGLISTPEDNLAYEIGTGGPTNAPLPDGAEFVVPKGVAVMIDAGALFKLNEAKISVGSETVDEDRSLASLQVLGTPIIAGETGGTGEVFFTSRDDESLGVDTDPLPTAPQPGQWAGIEFRNDFDYSEGRPVWETEGIFLDFVSHANIQYGGGAIDVSEPIVTPLQMDESRPTLIYNTITNSADAAISADPNSFLETNFNAPIFQRASAFTSDYDRVGPELSGNRLIGNSINGLFVRVETPAAGQLEAMTVSGRFDDRDIVHVLSEVLVLQGQPGGAVLLEVRPDVLSVTVNPMGSGTLDPLTSYDYRVTYIDADGSESLASLPTSTGVTSSQGALQLENLPTAPIEFAGRRLYRSVPGSTDYVFVTQLDRATTSYHDDGTTRGGILASEVRPNAMPVSQVVDGGRGGVLTPGQTFSYRLTFFDIVGGETQASDVTATFTVEDDGTIALENLPTAPADFEGVRLYRSVPGTNDYEMIAVFIDGETTYVDNGENIDLPQRLLPNEGNNGSRFLPRFDARLKIDPGLIIKSQTSRIEAAFGADFYAEGRDGDEIVFTSRLDDTYGAGGTFDTNNDGTNGASPGDWGGLIFRQDSTASLDHTEVRFGGGSTPTNGGFVEFNAIEILQADVRIANSRIVDNADGFVSNSIRDGIGFNEPAAIMIRGAQPILVDNIIEDNEGVALTINPDSLNQESVLDHGRATGPIDLFTADTDNQGPLIADNLFDNNAINGLRIRSEILTTDSVWDDTDIVHVVDGQVISATHHFYGALRLKSDPDRSLVVKFGNNAELIGTGRPLDIDDRIGGTLQVIGTPGNPVILTSINDASVGAGFTEGGLPQNDTVPGAGDPSPGDWQGLRLGTFINDRNVAYVPELETADPATIGTNAIANNAQIVGDLAAGEKASDENERLGFNIRGSLAANEDVDVYSFTATGGTRLFIDIDETDPGLDTVVELIDSNDNVLARSDDSFHEANDRSLLFSNLPDNSVQPLYQLGIGNVESPNPLDAGMRVILQGSSSTENTYFVRVRSNGKSQGSYELSLRLRETQEVAGSTVFLADIRYATEAITVNSAPLHSPLTSTAAEALDFTTIVDPTPGNPQSGDEYVQETYNNRLQFDNTQIDRLGNLGTSDRGALSVSGNIGNLSQSTEIIRLEDVDVYQVDLFTEQLGPDIFNFESRYVSTTFDIDYADGLGRPNTSIAVYDTDGRLVAYGSDSNITDDRGRALQGVDSENLEGGSAGSLDAYLGPIELPEGSYFVAVTNAAVVPSDLDQFFAPTPSNSNARLIPVNSTRRLIDDNFDDTSDLFILPPTAPSTLGVNAFGYAAERPIVEAGFDSESPVPYSLDDIRLFVSLGSGVTGAGNSSLVSVNPFTGVVERLVGEATQGHNDIAARADGEIFTYSAGNYLNLSAVNGSAVTSQPYGLTFEQSNAAFMDTEVEQDALLDVTALTFQLENNPAFTATSGFAQMTTRAAGVSPNQPALVVGNRTERGRGLPPEVPLDLTRNLLFLSNQVTGQIVGDAREFDEDPPVRYLPFLHQSGSNVVELGNVDTGFIRDTGGDGGDLTGITIHPDNGRVFGVTELGGVHSFSVGQSFPGVFNNTIIPTTFHGIPEKDPVHEAVTGTPTLTFSGVAFGPRVASSEEYRDVLFATTPDGWLYAFEIDDSGDTIPANVFYEGRYAVQLTFVDIASPDDNPLLFPSPTGLAFSNLEASPWHLTSDRFLDDGHGVRSPVDDSRNDGTGGQSLYFGFETPEGNVISTSEASVVGEVSPGGAHGSVVTRPFNLESYSANDKPTLYFSYFIEVEDGDDFSITQLQRDSFRVFGAGDDGEWQLLATNNSFRNPGSDDEFDYFLETRNPVQELFDDSGVWRQARIDLSPLVGSQNARIRFDVSTAGSMRTHFDSLELVAIPGDRIDDGEIIALNNELGNQIRIESVVGVEVLFGNGNEIIPGDVITLIGPEVTTSVQFVAGPAGPGQVQVNPTMSADEVAAAVVRAVDQEIGAINISDGIVQFRGANVLTVIGDSKIGETSPLLYQRIDTGLGEAVDIRVPDGDQILPGDVLTISAGGRIETYTFVDALTGADNEVLFAPNDSGDVIAQRLFALLPLEFQATYDNGNVITIQGIGAFVDGFGVVSPLTHSTGDAQESRIEVFFPIATIDSGEVYTIRHAEGTLRFQITAGGVAPIPGVQSIGVFPFATSEQIAQAVLNFMPSVTGPFVTLGNSLSVAASSMTVASNANALSIGEVTARRVTFPSGADLIDGERFTIIDDQGVFEFTFVESAVAGPPGQINFSVTDTAAAIAQRVHEALPDDDAPELDRFLDDDEIKFYGTPITYADDLNSNIISEEVAVAEVVIPEADELNVGDTLSFGVDFVTFVDDLTLPVPNPVLINAGESAQVVADRTNAVLEPLLQLRGLNVERGIIDMGDQTIFRVEVEDANYSGYNPIAGIRTGDQTLIGRDVLLIPLTSTVQDIRSGTIIELEPSPGGNGPTIAFVQQGDTIEPAADVVVYFNRNAVDQVAEARSIVDQIILDFSLQNQPFEVYVDPLGRGMIVNSPDARTVLAGQLPLEIDTNTIPFDQTVVAWTIPPVSEVRSGVDTVTVILKNQGLAPPQTFNFTIVDAADSTGAGDELIYDSTLISTSQELADTLIGQLPTVVDAIRVGPRQIYMLNAQIIQTDPASQFIGGGVMQIGNNPLVIDDTMLSRDVAQRLRLAIKEGVSVGDSENVSRETIPIYGGDRLRLYNLTPTSVGNFGVSGYSFVENNGIQNLTTSSVPGDEFGLGRSGFFANGEVSTAGASNNQVEGVYIDDVIIGFAERGELVLDGSTSNTFALDPAYLPPDHPLAVQPERQNEALLGPYSLEVRTADEFGVPEDYDPNTLILDEQFGIGRSFDTNDRLVDGAVSLLPIPGTRLQDGDTFVLSDGWREMTFEFDNLLELGVTPGNVPIVFNEANSARSPVAEAIRDAINSPQVQNVLDITASSGDSLDSAPTDSIRVELFGSSNITVNPSGGRFLKFDLVDAETSQGRETARQIPVVDQVGESTELGLFGDELDRSTPTGFVNARTDTFVGIGKIGDSIQTGQVGVDDGSVVLPQSPGADFDAVRVHLQAGDRIDIDVDSVGFSRAGEILDLPVITVFGDGDVLQEDLFQFEIDPVVQTSLFDPSIAPGEADGGAFLRFAAPATGFYNIAVSSANLFGTQEITIAEGVAAALLESESVTISAGFSQVTYVFSTNPNTVTPNTLILLDPTSSAEDIAELLAEAIRDNQSEFLRADAEGRNINLFDRGENFAVISPSLPLLFSGAISTRVRPLDFGEYSLSIRPTPDTGNVPQRDVLHVDYQFGKSDTNRVQDQGQLVISSNFITESAGTGVRAVSNQRGQTLVNTAGPGGGNTPNPDSLPQPGSASLLRNINNDALIPGVVISNNVIALSGDAGIEFGGDLNANGNIPAPAAFGRIVNNTVVNRGGGDGIRISGASSPTLLNNIINGFANGVFATGDQFGEVVVGGNAYRANNSDTNIGLASSSFVIPATVPLFQDPAREIYIPAPLSDVIDSSFSSLPDRQEFFQTVKEPVGISASPIISPEFDAYGQARVDDPLVTTPGGVGSNVFIDRGAIDRADDVRPTAFLVGPQDAINVRVIGGDQDPDASFVRLTEGTVSFFEIQLLDPAGTGIDTDSVTVEAVVLTENGRRLIEGRDYVFGYSGNSNSIRLTPLTGLWRPNAVYEITLNNKERLEVTMPAGDAIADGDQIVIDDANGGQTIFEFESGYSLLIPQTSTLTVTDTNAGFTDGELINITSPGLVVRELEFDTDGTLIQPGAIAVDISSAGTIQDVRDAILAALQSTDPIDPSMTVAEAVSLNPVAVGLDQVQLGTVAGHLVNESAAALTLTGLPGGVAVGDTFIYQTATETVTFEFTQTFVTDPAFVPILYSATDTPDQIAEAAAAAIAAQPLGLAAASAVGGGRVLLGGQVGDVATLNSAFAVLEGNPGVTAGTVAMSFIPSAAFTPSIAVATLENAIESSGIPVTAFNPGGGSLFVDGATSITATFGGFSTANIPAITDLAGNRIRETRVTDETRFTIVMPEVVLDFGDAPDSYGTRLAVNGARHTISDRGLPRLGAQLDNEVDGQPSPLSDDAPLALVPTSADALFEVLNPGVNVFTVSLTGAVPVGGEVFELTIGGRTAIFEMVRATDNPNTGNIPIVFATGESQASIAEKLFLAIRAQFNEIGASILMDLSGPTITLRAIDDEDGVPVGTFTSAGSDFQVFTRHGLDPSNLSADDVVGFINPLDPAGSVVPVSVTGSGLVDIFIDYDQNGVFNLAEEHAARSVPVVDGLSLITVPPIPAQAGDTWMRVRLSQTGNLSATGVAVGGEVEDYLVSVIPIALPTPIDDQYDAVEDTLLVIDSTSSQPDLFDNDLDIDTQLLPARYFIGQEPTNGTLTVTDNRAGEFTYLPNPDFYGTDTFTYRLSTQDNATPGANSTFATVTITVAPVNDLPGVEAQTLTGLEDTPLTIDASVLLTGANGHANPAIPTPPLDESNQNVTVIAITAGGQTLDAANQTGQLTTAEGGTLTASFDTDTTTGRTFITSVTYSPATDFNADNLPLSGGLPRLDEFTFTIEDDGKLELPDGTVIDGTPLSATETATIRVTPQNDAPTLATDLVSIASPSYVDHFTNQGLTVPQPTEDTSLVIPAAFLFENDLRGTATSEDETQGIRGNDGPLRIVSATVDPFFGTIEVLPAGDLNFVPADDIYGQVEFTYEVEDQGVDEAVDGTRVLNPMRTSITSAIFLEPVNDAPVAYDRSFSMTEAVEPAGPEVLTFTASDLLLGDGVLTSSPLMTTATSITVVDGTAMQDGETIVFTDSFGETTVIEFSTATTSSIGTDLLLTYTLAETADDIATNLATLMVNAGLGGVATGPTVSFPITTAASTSTYTTMISANTVGISIPDPATIVGGETIILTDDDGVTTTLELSTNGVAIGTPDALINFTPGVDTAAAVVALIRAELLTRGIGSIDAGGVAPSASLQFNRTSVTSLNEPTTNLSTTVDGDLIIVQGLDLVDGETVTLDDGLGGTIVVEFNTTGVPAPGTDVLIDYDFFDSGADLATELETALRLRDLGVTAVGDTLIFKQVTAAVAAPPVTSIVASPTAITVPAGAQIIDGETVDLTIDGQSVVIEFNSTGVLSPGSTHVVTVNPVDNANVVAANLEGVLRTDGFSAAANGSTVEITSVASLVVTELPDVAGDFGHDLIAPYNEVEQTLRVVTFATGAGVVDVDIVGDDTTTLMTDNGGQLELTFSGGMFVTGTYTPPVDYNKLPPFQPTDLFTYGIADDGRTTLPTSGDVRDLDDERSVEMATVTITVEPSNDAPIFTTPPSVELLEDAFGATIPGVVTNVLPGPSTAQDELATQSVSFSIIDALSTVPAGLMTQSPVVTDTGGLTVFPAPDAVGTAVYVIRGTDDHPTNPMSTDATLTVHVRPVNDAPRFDENVAGTSDINDIDEAYSVARQINPGTGEIVDATITYTLREDNTQAFGATEPYFIPLQRDPSVTGYNQVGLLDVFTVGPPNEADGTLGGDQSLDLFDFPMTTLRGGTLTEVRDTNDVVIGLNYVPPLNFNEMIGGTDTFVYTVQDGSVAGETYDINTGMLISDPQTASNRVEFVLNPVNDKPEFDINLLREDQSDPTSPLRSIETPEDAAVTVIDNFAFNINAGPPATAFDEVDVINGQSVQFTLTPLSFTAGQSADFFSELPTINPEGQLRFQPAPDVFGSFDFEILLMDDGPADSDRGDLTTSDPVTITIDVLPINDPPVVIPGVDLAFTLDEDQSIEIPVNGDISVPGLLDAFTPGPANESADLTPGGNQTVRIQQPTPISTASGGSLAPVFDTNNDLIALRYTPRANFVGMDSFIYTVVDDGVTVDIDSNQTVRNDPRIASNTVALNVLALNDPPQFSGANNVTVSEDAGPTAITNWATNVFAGPITAIDEIDSQMVEFNIVQIGGPNDLFVSAPVAVVDTNDNIATLQFEPAGNANGVGTFTVQLTDDGPDDTSLGHNNASDIRTFTIRVNPINDPPTFTAGGIITVDEDSGPFAQQWATDVSPGPDDESDQAVRFEVSTPSDAQDLFQSLPEISDDGILRFIPATNANGTVDVAVTAIDSGGARSTPITLRLIITPLNDQPIAISDALTTDEDALLVIPSSQLLANDIDPDLGNPGDTLTLVRPDVGLSLSGATVSYDVVSGQITYDPSTSLSLQALAPGETATDSFSYSVVDEAGAQSNLVTVALTVSGLNDAPIAAPDTPTLNPDGPTVIPVLDNDTDVDGTLNLASINITLQPAFGSLSIDNQTGVITFTAFQAFSEEDQFRYTVEDNLGAVSESVLVTIAANAAPIARDDQDATFLDESVDINVVANDNDPDADPGAPNNGLDLASIVIVGSPGDGAAVPRSDGTIRYIPRDGFVGIDTFQYTIADTEGRRSLAAEVEVQVVASRLQNPNLNADVNNDGNVSPIDALLVINRLARAGVSSIDVEPTDVGPPFYDVNGDRRITPSDALAVINELARRASSGEGEQVVSSDEVIDTPLLDLLSDREDDEDDRLGAIDEAFGDLL